MSTLLRRRLAALTVLAVLVVWSVLVRAQSAITWQSQTNVSVVSTTLTKTGGTDSVPDAGALSLEEITSAGGTFSFTATSTSRGVAVGLSNDAANNSGQFAGMSHAINFSTDTTYEVREGGVYQSEGSYTAGDVFDIAVDGSGNVLYKKNGATVDTSSATASLPKKLDVIIYTASASITAATYTPPAGIPDGPTWTVCASGCDFTNAQLPDAINAMSVTDGNTLLLQEGHEYVVDLTLPVKAGAGPSTRLQIRTGVNASGVVQDVSRYVTDGERICPSTYSEDGIVCSALPGSQDMSRIATIKVASDNAYAIRTANTGSGTPVAYWTLRWLEVKANSYGGNALIGVVNETVPETTGTVAMLPHDIIFDQVVVRGDPVSGQFRGFQIDGTNVSITNSFAYDIKALSEGQVLWANTSAGGLTLTNNNFSGGTETLLTGGSATSIRALYTVQASASTTSIPLDRVIDLHVGKTLVFKLNTRSIISNTAASPSVFTSSGAHGLTTGEQIIVTGVTCTGAAAAVNATGAGPWPPLIVNVLSSTTFSLVFPASNPATAVNCAGGAGSGGSFYTRASAEITAISGSTVTITPALPSVPASGTVVDSSIVIGQGTQNVVRYNLFTRPSSWRTTPVQAPPTSPSASSSTASGTLPAGTYYYRVQAQRLTAQGLYAASAPATEVSATLGATGRITISWTAAANASRYVIVGRATGAPTMYWTVTAPTVSFTDTGAAGTAASDVYPTSYWQVKNTFELKVGRDFVIEYNVIENAWTAGQSGPCVVFTPTQQAASAPSAVIRDVLFQKNVVRNCAQFLQLPGMDAQSAESARSGDISFLDNLWYNGNGTLYGAQSAIVVLGNGGGPRQHPLRGPYDVTFRRNTFHSTGNSYTRFLMIDACDYAQSTSLESPLDGFVFQDNIAYSGANGVTAVSIGTSTTFCNQGFINRRLGLAPSGPIGSGSTISHNVFAGDSNCAGYPANVTNLSCPSVATLEADTFTNTTTITGFAVKNTSTYFTASSTGGPLGPNLAAFASTIADYTLTGAAVDECGGLAIDADPSVLPYAYVGQSYSTTLTATCGTAPYTWALISGTLPTGLSLNTSTGAITGTPSVPIVATPLTFRVTDAAATQASEVFTLTAVQVMSFNQTVATLGQELSGTPETPMTATLGSVRDFVVPVRNTEGAYVDLTAATSIQFVFRKPNGVVITRTAERQTAYGGADAEIAAAQAAGAVAHYVSGVNDLDVRGIWRSQVKIVIGGVTYYTEPTSFEVM